MMHENVVNLMRDVNASEVTRQRKQTSQKLFKRVVALPKRVLEKLTEEQKVANRARNDRAVEALRSLLWKLKYTLSSVESDALDRRDENGNVDCVLIVDGFPVNPDSSWLDKGGNKLAQSMLPHVLQLGPIELLADGVQFVRIDIHPASAHWSSCHKLARAPMREVGRLLHAIRFSYEVLVFGKLAIDALRATAPCQPVTNLGSDYHIPQALPRRLTSAHPEPARVVTETCA